VTEDEIRDLGERVQQIAELTETIGWALFFDRAKVEITQHQNRILGGRLEEADYHREAGWVQGALAIIGLPQQTITEFQRARTRYDEEKQLADDEAALYETAEP
jgi:hypothetical protein